MSKLLGLEQAAALVPSGAHISISGFANALCPMGLVRQMIRQDVTDLELSGMGEALPVDLLCAAGRLRRVRVSNFMLEGSGRCPNFSRMVESGVLEVEDYSHFGITSRLFAGGAGMPFLPVGSMKGSDLEYHATFDAGRKMAHITDPFTGEDVTVVPALRPDFALVHVARADAEGNCQLFGISSSTLEIARAAHKVIVTAEEICSTEEIRARSGDTLLPGFLVHAVVHAPYGAHPAGLYGYYDFDSEHLAMYAKAGRDPEAIAAYLQEYLFDLEDEAAYLEKVGITRLLKLRADPASGVSLAYRKG